MNYAKIAETLQRLSINAEHDLSFSSAPELNGVAVEAISFPAKDEEDALDLYPSLTTLDVYRRPKRVYYFSDPS